MTTQWMRSIVLIACTGLALPSFGTEPKQLPVLKVCTEKGLPLEKMIQAAELSALENPENKPESGESFGEPPSALRLAITTGKKWQLGRVLHVRFIGSTEPVHEKVLQVAQEWSKYANIQFEASTNEDAEIRIAFESGGSWSYVGTDALTILKKKPTMNLGWITEDTDDDEVRRVVLHEFGHALGGIHEHQSPEAGIPWNKEAVYSYYAKPPNKWKRPTVDENIFKRYSFNTANASKFDIKSIMLYAIPKELTTDGFETPWNTELSEMDKQFIATEYPKSVTQDTP